MTEIGQVTQLLAVWQTPVAFCAVVFMFSLGFITVSSIR